MIPRGASRCGRVLLVVCLTACAGTRATERQQPPPTTTVVVPASAPASSTEPASVVVAEAPPRAMPAQPAAREEQSSGLPMPPPAAVRVAPDKGGILRLMPAQCRERVYVNVAALLGSDATTLSKLLDNLAQAVPSGKATKALKILRDAGLDPVLALKELAFSDGPDLAVVRIEPTRPGNVLGSLQAALAEFESKPATVVPWGPMRVLRSPSSDELLVEVTPTVLLLADHSTVAQAALSELGGASGFGDAGRQLIWFRGSEGEVQVSEAKGELILVATEHVRQPERGNQANQVARVRKELDELARGLAQSPFGLLAPKLRAAQVRMVGNDVVARASLKRTELSQLVQQLAAAKPADLATLLRRTL